MIKSIKDKDKKKIEIDLTGPEGNAFVLLGKAKKLAEQTGKSWELIKSEMVSGDYNNLIKVFDREFGDLVILYR